MLVGVIQHLMLNQLCRGAYPLRELASTKGFFAASVSGGRTQRHLSLDLVAICKVLLC